MNKFLTSKFDFKFWTLGAALLLGVKCLLLEYDYLDVFITRQLQELFEDRTRWAEHLTSTAKWPWILLNLGLALGLTQLRFGVRYLPAIPISYAAAFGLDQFFKLFVYVHKPDSELVYVSYFSKASGWPSTFCCIFGALYGVFLFSDFNRANINTQVFRSTQCLAFLMLTFGTAGRIVLGGHWPAQALSSLFMGMFLAILTFQIFYHLNENQS